MRINDRDGFYKEYLIQTRQEIESIRREINRFLYFVFLVIGAVGFALTKNNASQSENFFFTPYALAIETSALIIVTSLFWLRLKNIQQKADRWFVLERILARSFQYGTHHEMKLAETLENLVCNRLRKERTYTRQEFILNISLSLPLYGMLTISAVKGFHFPVAYRVGVAASVVLCHAVISYVLLYRHAFIKDALPQYDAVVENRQ